MPRGEGRARGPALSFALERVSRREQVSAALTPDLRLRGGALSQVERLLRPLCGVLKRRLKSLLVRGRSDGVPFRQEVLEVSLRERLRQS